MQSKIWLVVELVTLLETRFYAPFDSKYGPANTWNPMPDRGSVTENHYDHVHVSMNG